MFIFFLIVSYVRSKLLVKERRAEVNWNLIKERHINFKKASIAFRSYPPMIAKLIDHICRINQAVQCRYSRTESSRKIIPRRDTASRFAARRTDFINLLTSMRCPSSPLPWTYRVGSYAFRSFRIYTKASHRCMQISQWQSSTIKPISSELLSTRGVYFTTEINRYKIYSLRDVLVDRQT